MIFNIRTFSICFLSLLPFLAVRECNQKGFIITGGSPSIAVGNHVEVYNLQSGSQCELPDLPGQRRYAHSMCGNLLCGGGEDRDTEDTDTSCLLLDTSTGQFYYTSVTLRQRRDGHLCWNVGGEGGDKLIIGGDFSSSSTELVSSDGRTSSESFTLKYDTDAACGIQIDDTFIITGGFDLYWKDLKKVTSYSRVGEPRYLPDLNVGRYDHACGHFVNNEGVTVLLVTGGYHFDNGHISMLDSTEVLEDNTWEMSASLPSARSGLRAASVANTIFVFGGEGRTSSFNTILRYDDKKKSWEEEGQMMKAKRYHAVEVLEDVSLLCP